MQNIRTRKNVTSLRDVCFKGSIPTSLACLVVVLVLSCSACIVRVRL